jgi:hypothetical protein
MSSFARARCARRSDRTATRQRATGQTGPDTSLLNTARRERPGPRASVQNTSRPAIYLPLHEHGPSRSRLFRRRCDHKRSNHSAGARINLVSISKSGPRPWFGNRQCANATAAPGIGSRACRVMRSSTVAMSWVFFNPMARILARSDRPETMPWALAGTFERPHRLFQRRGLGNCHRRRPVARG